jgi:co-chaperonin GroES (HSP10)
MTQLYKPFGARLLVDPIETTLSLEDRAQRAGLEIVLEQDHRPRPTQGRVVALGADPLLQESIKIGDVVFFAPYSGNDVVLEGVTFRQLELQDVTGVMTSSPQTDQSSSEGQLSPVCTPESPE